MSLLRTIRTVLWSFVGIRRKSGYEEDLGRANPVHVIAVALVVVVLFVAGLIVLVNWVVKN